MSRPAFDGASEGAAAGALPEATEPRPSVAERFHALFGGGPEHGTYDPARTETRGDGKVGITAAARTLPGAATVAMWEQHLAGTRPLGIVLIREDQTCLSAALDIDVYDIFIPDLVALVEQHKIPAVVCRSKSGMAHVYLFFAEPVPAERVRRRLKELAILLGYPSAEIFPKQDAVAWERGEHGSWINMPYFGGSKTERPAITAHGSSMTMLQFLERAESLRMTRAALEALPLAKQVRGRKQSGRKMERAREAIEACIGRVAEAGAGERNNVANKEACTAGGFAEWAELPEAYRNAIFEAIPEGERDHNKDRDVIRRAWRDGERKPIEPHEPGGGHGKKVPPLLAATRLLRADQEWAGVLAFDEFSRRMVLRKAIPGAESRGGNFPRPARPRRDRRDAVAPGKRRKDQPGERRGCAGGRGRRCHVPSRPGLPRSPGVGRRVTHRRVARRSPRSRGHRA